MCHSRELERRECRSSVQNMWSHIPSQTPSSLHYQLHRQTKTCVKEIFWTFGVLTALFKPHILDLSPTSAAVVNSSSLQRTSPVLLMVAHGWMQSTFSFFILSFFLSSFYLTFLSFSWTFSLYLQNTNFTLILPFFSSFLPAVSHILKCLQFVFLLLMYASLDIFPKLNILICKIYFILHIR